MTPDDTTAYSMLGGTAFRADATDRRATIVDANRDLSALIIYSYDGVALGLESLQMPTELSTIPCRDRVEDLIAGRPEKGLLARPAADFLGQMSELRQASPNQRSHLRLWLRDGRRAYSYDVVGDGTQVIHYTSDGAALELECWDWELGVVVDNNAVPFRSEIRSLLTQSFVPVVGQDVPGSRRPVLDLFGPIGQDLAASFAYGGRVELPGGESELRGGDITLDAGANVSTLWLYNIGEGAYLEGLPASDRLAVTLGYRGISVLS